MDTAPGVAWIAESIGFVWRYPAAMMSAICSGSSIQSLFGSDERSTAVTQLPAVDLAKTSGIPKPPGSAQARAQLYWLARLRRGCRPG